MKKEELALIRKYLNGNTSKDEIISARKILVSNKENNDLKELLKNEWNRTPTRQELLLDIEKEWHWMSKVIKDDVHVSSGRSQTPTWHRMAIAASLTLIVTVGVILLHIYNENDGKIPVNPRPEFIQKVTGKGEKMNVSLPDGSFIKLNSSSKLSILTNYQSGHERIVHLKGEAFFDIAEYEHKPFRVITGRVTTTVFGTSFNVNAPSESEEVEVALVTGKVKVANDKNEITLDVMEKTILLPSTTELSKSSFDLETVTGWRNDILVFDEISFHEIIKRLEQWYGVEFEITGTPPDTDKTYSGRFQHKSLATVLEGLGFSSEFSYEIKDKTVLITF
ncbi:DUF4974 domain-containing protein [Fulvivirga sp. M361]|uniref:FecR family protein n=1 Tax=Fulvivirga sp. M361 TaxID=2594266 RepID=UPI00117B21BE|nr:FecR domain-containing protein [Fulvivirga sp. M361]TRX49678.1 DUF4974 domain-containing protein [Fulvivirga sp. M361]